VHSAAGACSRPAAQPAVPLLAATERLGHLARDRNLRSALTKADARHRMVCFVNASNDGGEILAGPAGVMSAR
jgi:hypothetical protein